MRILITNDDGIHAEGIEVLERIARTISDDIWVVAPSATSRASRIRCHCPSPCACASWTTATTPSAARRPIA